MKSEINYWCAVGIVKQQAFREDGTTYDVDKDHPVGDQHILYQGVLMCGASRETLKNKLHAKKVKSVKIRLINVPLCKKCEAKYKANSNLAWSKWALSVSQKAPIMGLQDAFKEVVSEQLHGVK